MEALKAERSAQKDKEAILRNHAHYKDANAVGLGGSSQSKKEDGKKKALPPAHKEPAKSSDPHTSKKAAKKAAAAAKAAAQGQTPIASNSSQTKDAQPPQTGAPANPPPKQKPVPSTPKAPRANRERQGSRGAASAAADAGKVALPSVGSNPAPAATPAVPVSESGAASSSQPVANSSRQGRPVVGLASRQFEAALSGAVGGKPRREREKAKDAPAQANTPASGPSAAATTSPRNRPKQVSSIASAANAPTILHREGQESQTQPAGIVTRPAAADSGGAPTSREEGSGGGRRGQRGRGRGRGVRGGRGG